MPINVLIINGHPRKDSFSEALTLAYAAGAGNAGVNIEKLPLSDLSFNPNVTHFTPRMQLMEPDIEKAQALISWADHIVFIYPTWWGTMPALLKGFIDRTFTAGFAFEDIAGGTGYAPLLRGKSAQIITTMDTPLFVYNWIYKAPGHNAMRKATLQFCGFNLRTTLNFGPVKDSAPYQREKWLEKAREEGERLKLGRLSQWNKVAIKTGAWIKAIRLQFYPMTCIAYATGGVGAAVMGYSFQRPVFWLGYLWLFFLEVMTVLINEYYDFKSDVQNKYFSLFTGGSRVIVDRQLSFAEVGRGIFTTLLLSAIALCELLFSFSGSITNTLIVCASLFVLAPGYTLPPLRLSYRGLGELTVGITHSFAVVVCGYMFQGGSIGDSFTWLLSAPLFLSILPSIILAGLPDYDADKAHGKRTLAVRAGKKGAAGIAMAFTLLAAATVIVYKVYNVLPVAFSNLLYFVVPHAVLLTVMIYRYIKAPSPPPRIDSLLIAALTYLVWFGLVPLVRFMIYS